MDAVQNADGTGCIKVSLELAPGLRTSTQAQYRAVWRWLTTAPDGYHGPWERTEPNQLFFTCPTVATTGKKKQLSASKPSSTNCLAAGCGAE